MANLLYERDSTARCRRSTVRHVRLLRRLPGTEVLVNAIIPLNDALKERADVTEEKSLERDCAYDFVIAADFEQDNTVRTVFNAVENYDREHPTAPVLRTIFPDATFGDIVRESLSVQPDTVDTLAARITGLGANHALLPHAEALATKAKAVRTALAAHAEAVRALKIAEAEEEISRSALRRQYESNYFRAREMFGRPLAENLFPVLTSKRGEIEEPAEAKPATAHA